MAAKKTSETRYTSESQRHWWNGVAAKLFAAGPGEMRGVHGFSGGWKQ